MFVVDTSDIENLGVLPKELARDLVSRETFDSEYCQVSAPWSHSAEDTLWIMDAAAEDSYEYWLHAFSGLPEVLALLLKHWRPHIRTISLASILKQTQGVYESKDLYRAAAEHCSTALMGANHSDVLTRFVENHGYEIAASAGCKFSTRIIRAHLDYLFTVKKVSFTQALDDPFVIRVLEQSDGRRRLLGAVFCSGDVTSILEAYQHPEYRDIWLENFSYIFSRRRFDVVYQPGISTICSDLGQILAAFVNDADMHAEVSEIVQGAGRAIAIMLTSFDDLFGAPKAVIQAIGMGHPNMVHPELDISRISNGTIKYLSAYGADGAAALDSLSRLGLVYTFEHYLAAPQTFAAMSTLSFHNHVRVWRELYFRVFRDGEVLEKNEKRFLDKLTGLFSHSTDLKMIQLRPDELNELNTVMYSSLEALAAAPNAVKLALPYLSEVKAARRIAYLLIENANSGSYNKSLASTVIQGKVLLPYYPHGSKLKCVSAHLVSSAVLIELGMRTLNGGVLNSNECKLLVESIEMIEDSQLELNPLMPNNTPSQWKEFLLGVAEATSYLAALWLGEKHIFQEIFLQVFQEDPDLPGVFVSRISEAFKDSSETPIVPTWFLNLVLTGPLCCDVPFGIVKPAAVAVSAGQHMLGVIARKLSDSYEGHLQALELLPTWKGSINELVDTVRSSQG